MMIETIDSLPSSVTSLSGTPNGAASRARAVLEELDRRYEPARWRLQVRRHGAVFAALALVVIAIAGTGAILASRRHAG
jgi:hypothetical protein